MSEIKIHVLHTELQNKGDFVVTVVCPGPTNTKFSSRSQMAGFQNILNKIGVTAESVAVSIIRGIERKKQLLYRTDVISCYCLVPNSSQRNLSKKYYLDK